MAARIRARVRPRALGFTRFVDSVGGSDANNGLTAYTQEQTFAGLGAPTAGMRVGATAGSTWREAFGGASPASNVTIGFSGSGAVPLITGSDTHNSGWALQAGKTNVYEKSIAHDATGSSRLTVYTSAGVLLTRVANAATCESTAGSFVDKIGSDGTPWLVQVHMPNSATPNGQSPEVAVRLYAVALGDGGAALGPLRVQRALSNNGALDAVNRTDVAVSRVLAANGTKHNIGIGSGSIIDSIAWQADPTTAYEPSNTSFVAFLTDPTGKSFLWERCGAYQSAGYSAGLGQSFGTAHGGSESLYFATGTLRQCWAVGKLSMGHPGGQQNPLSDSVTEGCFSDAYDHGMRHGVVRYGLAYNRLSYGALTGDLQAIALSDCAAYFEERKASGNNHSPLAIFNNNTRSITRSAFAVGGPASTGVLFGIISAGGGALSVTRTVFWGAGTQYEFQSGTGVTYTGNYNVFLADLQSDQSRYFSSVYQGAAKNTLAAWQAATGQDAQSVYLVRGEQDRGDATAFWLGVANNQNDGPKDGDWRVNPNAKVYGGDGTAYTGTFPDGTLITTVGPQNYWNWNTRASVAGAPTRFPTVPATLAEGETYIGAPTAWNFYP